MNDSVFKSFDQRTILYWTHVKNLQCGVNPIPTDVWFTKNGKGGGYHCKFENLQKI